MTTETINRFLEYATWLLSDIITPVCEHTELREVYCDYALLVFKVPEPQTPEELIDNADCCTGLRLMYHHKRSRHTDYGQSLCFFQEPGAGSMFQMNATTDGTGRISQIDVRIFSSMERMVAELRDEMRRTRMVGGSFAYEITDEEILGYFL